MSDEEVVIERKRSSRLKVMKKSKKKKMDPTNVSSFFDTEAQEDEEDDEEEEEDEQFDFYAEEAGEAAEVARQLDRAERKRIEAGMTEKGYSRSGGTSHLTAAVGALEKRFAEAEFEEEDELAEDEQYGLESDGEYGDIQYPAQFLPDLRDSKLWSLKLNSSAKQREACVAIARKATHNQLQGRPFPIKSVYGSESSRNWIYIEADSPAEVHQALQGMRLVNLNTLKVVATKDLQSVFFTKPIVKIEKGTWVRIKRGYHRNDLALVFQCDEMQGIATVRVIPRINWTEKIESIKKKVSENNQRNAKQRSLQRFFDREEIERLGGDVDIDPSTGPTTILRFSAMLFEEETGFQLKKIPLRFLVTDQKLVNPSQEEMREFINRLNPDEFLYPAQESSTTSFEFVAGDTIKVVRGELRSFTGKVISVEETSLTIDVPEVTGAVSIRKEDVMKYFEPGCNVKCLNGPHEGEFGIVTHVDESSKRVSIFSTSTLEMFTSTPEGLQNAPSTAISTQGLLNAHGYAIGDLVQVASSSNTVLIFQINTKTNFCVLTTENEVLRVPPTDLSSKRVSIAPQGLDAEKNTIVPKMLVSIIDGEHKGKLGRVSHIHKRTVFLKINGQIENNGYLAVEQRHTQIQNTPAFIATSSRAGNTGDGPARRSIKYPRGPRDPLMGKHVRILTGRRKGYLGTVTKAASQRSELWVDLLCDPGRSCKVFRKDLETADARGGVGLTLSNTRLSHNNPARTPSTTSHKFPLNDGLIPLPSREEAQGINENDHVTVVGGKYTEKTGIVKGVFEKDNRMVCLLQLLNKTNIAIDLKHLKKITQPGL